MAGAKVVVLYPTPRDVGAFEQAYNQDHAPMVTPRTFSGLTRFVASKVLGTPDGSPPSFHRIAELHFPSMEVLRAATASPAAQEAVAHAISISTGGMPVFLVADEEVQDF
jgi:uncharacterized protein (TIGR02118 family)